MDDNLVKKNENNESKNFLDKEGTNQEIEKIEIKRKKRKRNKKIRFVIYITCIIIAIIYLGGVVFFTSHFCPGSKLLGINCSFMTAENLEQKLNTYAENFKCNIREEKAIDVIYGNDVEMKIEKTGTAFDALKEQNQWKWFLISNEKNIPIAIDVSLNEELLQKKAEELPCVIDTKQTVQDIASCIEYSEEEHKFIVNINENNLDYGKKIIDIETFFSVIKNGFNNLEDSIDLESKNCYLNLRKAVNFDGTTDTMNHYCDTVVEYTDIKNNIIALLDGGSIHEWLHLDNELQVYIDESQVKQYVSDLAVKCDTYGGNHNFITANGTEITVAGGDYGWKVDQKTECKTLTNDIINGEKISRQPQYKYEAFAPAPNDIGPTYVEVSINAQKLWLYKDGVQVLSSNVVTGNPLAGNSTKCGVYSIKFKQRNTVLKGDGYSTPVNFWMPFNGGQGLHDATWRGAFGGNIYRGGGSHGCVNLPYATAQTIFGSIDEGTPVVVY